MELDEFKQTYQRFGSSFHHKSNEELQKILHNQAGSVLENVKRSLKVEVTFAILFILFLVYVLVNFRGAFLTLIASLILGFSLLFTGYLIALFQKIRNYYAASGSVTDNIKQLTAIITRFIRLYFQITMAFIPVVCTLVAVTVITDEGNAFISVTLSNVLIYSTASLVWCVVMYFFTRWYIKLLYGKHLQHLRNHLMELENKF